MKEKIFFEAVTKASDNNYYGSDQNGNGLYKINIDTGETSYLSLFENEEINKKRLHAKAEKYGNKIIFIPSSANYITIYDYENNKQAIVEIPKPKKMYSYYVPQYKFIDSYIFNDKLILLPSSYPGILIYDLLKENIEIIDHWVTEVGYLFRKGSCRIGNKIYIPDTKSNFILEFNLISGNIYQHHVGKSNQGCWSCNSCNDKEIWLSPKNNGPIIKWNIIDGITEEYNEYPKSFVSRNFLFSKIYFVNSNPYFIPVYSNMFITVDEKNQTINKVNCKYVDENTTGIYHFETEEFIYISIINKSGEERGFKISKNNNTITSMDFYIYSGLEKKLDDILKFSNSYISESSAINLSLYLSYIKAK